MAGFLNFLAPLAPIGTSLEQSENIGAVREAMQGRNRAAELLVNRLGDEYEPLKEAGKASQDWPWVLSLVGGAEGATLRQQHFQQTVKEMTDKGIPLDEATRYAAAMSGDMDLYAKLTDKKGKESPEDINAGFADALKGKLPPDLRDDITRAMQPGSSDAYKAQVNAELKDWLTKRFARTYHEEEFTEDGQTYKGLQPVPSEEAGVGPEEGETPPGAPPAAPGAPAPTPPPAAAAPPGTEPPAVPPPVSTAPPGVAPPGGPPPVGGRGMIGVHRVPGPAAAIESRVQTNLQQMGPTTVAAQKAMLDIGGGDVNKAQQIFDSTMGSRAIQGFLGRYPGKLGDAMLALKTYADRRAAADRASQQILSVYGMSHAESPIKASSTFWDVMKIMQDSNDSYLQTMKLSGWKPDPSFSRFRTVEELQADAAKSGGGAAPSSGPTDIHGRKMRFVPGP